MEVNFVFGGSVSAEQNHAIVTDHIGMGVNFCIAKHIKLLADQQMHLANVLLTEEDKLISTIDQLKSNKLGLRGENESKASKVLSSYMYENCLSQSCNNMQHKVVGNTVHSWYCYYDL